MGCCWALVLDTKQGMSIVKCLLWFVYLKVHVISIVVAGTFLLWLSCFLLLLSCGLAKDGPQVPYYGFRTSRDIRFNTSTRI